MLDERGSSSAAAVVDEDVVPGDMVRVDARDGQVVRRQVLLADGDAGDGQGRAVLGDHLLTTLASWPRRSS